jgi:hypothetical protein
MMTAIHMGTWLTGEKLFWIVFGVLVLRGMNRSQNKRKLGKAITHHMEFGHSKVLISI